jgi:peptidoglycan/LPS O-acetylase OafA/YrhL
MAEVVRSAAPDLAHPERKAARFPLFDGFRAIAAVSVVLTHVAFDTGFEVRSSWGRYFARADVGVAIFFLISGFLLYRPFVARRLRGDAPPATGPFLWRRILRIYPAYWAALVGVVVFGGVTVHGWSQWVRYITLTHVYWPATVFGPILQSWTLAVEVAFYLFLPIYALAQRRLVPDPVSRERKLRAELIGIAVLVVVAWAYRAFLASRHSTLFGVYNTWLPSWLDHFGFGMLLATVSAWKSEQHDERAPAGLDRRGAPAVCWAIAAIAFWLVATQLDVAVKNTLYTVRDEMVVHVFYAIVAFFILLPGIFGPSDRGLIRRVLGNRVVQYVGLVSYGVYLWHELWIIKYRRWAGAPADMLGGSFPKTVVAVLALTVATATVSWFVLERPLLRYKNAVPGFLRR